MKRIRIKAYCLLLIMVCNVLTPIPGWALSGGNKAPEFESFQPFGLDNMVDPATGDFSYNIPLMNVGFHGINLFYQAGITMDQEATMVGLGWNINSGMIDRNVRGIPDDFNGDEIVKKMSTKPYTTVGVTPGVGFEFFGITPPPMALPEEGSSNNSVLNSLNLSFGVYNNSYDGLGFEYSVSPAFAIGKRSKGTMLANIGLDGNTDGGTNLNFGLKNFTKSKETNGNTFDIGGSINSRSGLKSLSLSTPYKLLDAKIKTFYLGANLSFFKPSYIQDIEFPRRNTSFEFNAKVGGELFGFFGNVLQKGYFNKVEIAEKVLSLKSFGMLYFENKTDDGLFDFHRHGDIPQSEDVPNLAVPLLDFDTYSVSGPGMSGSFQIDRGDIGILHDRVSSLSSFSGSIGVEVGPPVAPLNFVHLGVDAAPSISIEKIKMWDTGLDQSCSFKNVQYNQSNFEKAILRKTDDLSVEIPKTNDLLTQIKGSDLIRANVKYDFPLNFKVDGTVNSWNDNTTNQSLANIPGKKNSRNKRTSSITYKTFKEAKSFGFTKYLNIYPSLEGIAKNHHIAEIIVENEDGYKYIYGVPVYNISQVEETFSVSGSPANNLISKNIGLISYDNGIDNNVGNKKGKDNYYSSTIVAPYVSTYLLTAIVSKDYKDLTGNGPTVDDYGDYVRFEYAKVDNYFWKTPTTPNGSNEPMASLSTGFDTEYGDDKGHIVYGERQQYVPYSIKNKNEIAIYSFYENGREDGYGEKVSGEQFQNSIKALKSITKYAIDDYELNNTNAEKLKTVLFEYNYELCKGIYNNPNPNEGKLTLKKLYVLNGESSKGRFSPYEFTYSFNPNYQPKAVNRYASFQPRIIGNTNDQVNITNDNQLCTVDYPYVPQNDNSLQNSFVSSWNLKKIKLPSGGLIQVEYEADDYAYVQNKKAMKMVMIKGFSDQVNSQQSELTNGRNYVHFEIEDQNVINELVTASTDERKEIIKQYYLRDIFDKLLYFKVYGRLKPVGNFNSNLTPNHEINEFVPGWAKIDKTEFGVLENGTNNFSGYIKLEEVCLNERKVMGCNVKVNPIAKTLMQALRLNLPGYLYGTENYNSQDESESGIINSIQALTSLIQQLAIFAVGVNTWMNSKGFGHKINLDKSFIRLYDGSRQKQAGSHRVKSIAMVDNFADMTNGVHNSSIYGKRYTYSTTEKLLGKNLNISSGVSAYEPAVGGDENPFFMAIEFKEDFLFAPDNTKYQENPMMEDYFPGPQIIYSKVTTSDLYDVNNDAYDDNNDAIIFANLEDYMNTGFSENHFHTYKDYPIKVEQTDKAYGDPYKLRKFVTGNLLSLDYYTASQGYFIYNPLMHGKPKANYAYNSSGQLISGQEMYYKEKSDYNLAETVPVFVNENNNLTIKDARMGMDYKLHIDTREHQSQSLTAGVEINMDIPAVVAPPLTPAPMPTPKIQPVLPSGSDSRFRSIVLVKSIRQQGVLYKTVAINGTSRITTEHLLWDAETGQPIVSQTFNEFDDPVYQVNLPAHLAYKGMGLAYQNIHATFTNVAANNGIVTNNTAFISATQEGDLLINNSNTNPSEYWVLRKSSNSAFLIDKNGNPASFANEVLRIEESGYSNQAGAAIASYITRKNPIVGNRLVLDEAKEIIDANATTYKEKWQSYCDIVNTKDGGNNDGKGDEKPDGRPDTRCLNTSGIVNPFLLNIKGNWRPEKSYVFQTDRKSTNNIRVDGPYITKPDNYNNTFTNFWQETGGQYVASPGKWTWTTENTLVSPFGNELEARDPLNRYSAELYGYNSQKVVAVAANARYQDIAYYGAEVPLQNGVDIYGQYLDGNNLCRPLYHLNILDGKRTKHNDNIKPNSGDYYMKFLSGKMNVLNFNTSSVAEIACDPNNQGPYKMTDCDCIKQFKPTQGKKYLLSAWLYAPCLQDDACTNKPYIEVSLSGGGSAATFKIEEYGPVIEGWRKVSGTFVINNQQQGKISIKNSIADIYMDDLRIHPYHATMKTYNYDLKTLRFTFEHDDNNFFTRYDYAKDGTLLRVSKQTERGIQTLQESTFGQQKTN